MNIAWLAHCIGTGGADLFMGSVTRCWETIKVVGIAVEQPPTRAQQCRWQRFGISAPVHAPDEHTDFSTAATNACESADAVISWCCDSAGTVLEEFPGMRVELVQNQDERSIAIARGHADCVDYIVAVNPQAAELAGNCCVIPNAADLARCLPRLGRVAQRAAWGMSDDVKLALFCGRLVPEKHPELILHALQKMPGWEVVLMGEGPMRDHLIRLAEHTLPHRVHFADFNWQIGDALAAADCVVLPSDYEGDALILHEACAAGVPVVCSDLAAVRQRQHEHGIQFAMIAEQTPSSLADSMRKAVTVDWSDARQITLQHYTAATIAAQWERVLWEWHNQWALSKMLGGKLSTVIQSESYQ